MAEIITGIGALSTTIIGYVGALATAVVAAPILLIPVGVGILGVGVGIFKGFMHR